MKKLKIVNKNKFIRANLFIITGLVIILFIGLTQSYSKTNPKYKLECITRGDTLWSIAEYEIKNNDYYKNQDVRKVIYEIKKINNLEGNELKEGIELKIPIY